MKLKLKTLMAGDIFFAGLSFYLALYIRFGLQDAHLQLFSKPLVRVTLYVVLLVTVAYIFEVYGVSKQRNYLHVLRNILQSVFVSFLGLSALIFINPDWMIGRGLLGISLTLFVGMQFSWHLLFRTVFGLPYLSERIVIVGLCEPARKIGDLIKTAEDVNHTLCGYVACSDCKVDEAVIPADKILGRMDQLLEIVTRASATKLIISNPQHVQDGFFQNLLLNCKLLGVEISDIPSYFESVSGKLMLESMDMNSMIYSSGFRKNVLATASKRAVDVMISAMGIVLTLPVFPFVALLVKINSPGPVFYRQVRVGHLGRLFTLYKFRTMGTDSEKDTGAVWAQENDPRIRPIGRFLRKSRLDEIPQLFNVLTGDMSFIGPRPERPEFVNRLQELIPFYSKRHYIKPGITGWAQIKHPYGASTEESFEKLRYDLYYFKNMNPVMDTMIFLKTIKVIISQFGGR